jgi:hypothetical protein
MCRTLRCPPIRIRNSSFGAWFNQTYSIRPEQLGAFSGNVTLACASITLTSGTPITCSNVSFSTNPISGGGTSTMTVTTAGGTTHTTYNHHQWNGLWNTCAHYQSISLQLFVF